ncbi:hypothetical protein KAT92_02835, partial [Candidatus Babeliales bacterium]|nr:hypothetical protein [Candidatus Babeliales bacterium]
MRHTKQLLLTLIIFGGCSSVNAFGPDIGGVIGKATRKGKEFLAEHAETIGHARLKEAEQIKKEIQEAVLEESL